MLQLFSSPTSAEGRLNRFLIASCLSFALVVVTFALCYVPMNMDEAGIFHVLACLDHPYAEYNIFREPCYVKNDLNLWGGFHLLRAQFYTGLTHALLYLPFYKFFHSQAGQYIFCLAFLIGFLVLLGRQTQNKALTFAIGASFYPFIFQFIHDTGPVKFALLLYPLIALWVKQIFTAPSPLRYAFAVILGLVVVVATEEKAFFIYLLPSIFFYAMAYVSADETKTSSLIKHLRHAALPLVVAGGVSLLGLSLLMFGINKDGITYLQWLMALAQNNKSSLSEWITIFGSFQFFWPMFSHYHFDLAQSAANAGLFKLITFLFMGGYGAVVWFYRKSAAPSPLQCLFLLLSYLSLLLVFGALRNTWAGHHFIFMWVPLILFFATTLDKIPATPRAVFVGLFLTLNIASLLVLTQNKFLVKINDEKEVIYAYLNDERRASESIYSFTTWGGYFIQALYGPKTQMAVYTEPYEATPSIALYPEYAQKLLDISRFTGRKLYTICYEPPSLCSKESLETAFAGKASFEEVLPGLQHWHLFLAKERTK